MRTLFHISGVVTLLFSLSMGSLSAHAFSVSGAIVDLSPTATGGELNLDGQTTYLDAARQPQDPTAALVVLMAQLDTVENRRAAYAWIFAISRRPAIEAPAALYALVRACMTDGASIMQAATFAQSKAARGYDLNRWAAAAGLPDPTLRQLAALAGDGGA